MRLRFLEYTKKEDIKVIEFPSNEANEILKQDKEISEYLDELNEHSVGELLIDKNNDDLIGYVFVYKKKYPGFIYNIFVYPKYRGKGFGKRLTRDAIEKYNGIDLTVDKTNYRAIQLYKGFGFYIVGEGNTEDEYYMKLKSEIDESIEKDVDIELAKEFLNKVRELAEEYGLNFFCVTDGASAISNNGNPAVENARQAQIDWEIENGFDPNEDWSNSI